MSDFVYSRHGGDLIVAEHAADEQAVRNALKDYDPHLRLVWEVDPASGRQVYNVVHVWSPDHAAIQVYTHRASGVGEPLPLTMRVVDEVKRLREQEMFTAADTMNARKQAAVVKDARDAAKAIAEDHAPYVDRNRVQITTAGGHLKPSYMRNRRLKDAA